MNKYLIISTDHVIAELGEKIEDKGIDEFERRFITHRLERNQWRMEKTADELGIDRTTLYKKIQKYGISKPF